MSDTSSDDANEPIEPANKDLSKVMGQLSVTENSDKTSSTKNLSDMPANVFGLIIERSDYKEQLILRKTSKSLRALVDKQKPACTDLEVSCKLDYIFCHYNGHCVAYVSPTCDQEAPWSECENYLLDKIVSKVNYEQVAFDDLASVLKNPKLQLEYFSFDAVDINDDDVLEWCEDTDSFECKDDRDWEYRYKFENMQNILNSISHQLSVKEFRINISGLSNVMSILPYMKPGVLEKITIFSDNDDDILNDFSEEIEQVALLEQWKQAKELELEGLFAEEFLEHATQFKRFQFEEGYIDLDKLVLFRDYILKHENVEFCSIWCNYSNMDDFQGVVGLKVSPNSSHYSIPNSDDYLEFMFKGSYITIEKKKKQ